MSKPLNLAPLCRWLFRLALLMLAVPVGWFGVTMMRNPDLALPGAVFLAAALMLPLAEPVFCAINQLEKKIHEKNRTS